MLAPSLIELSLHFKTQPCARTHPESLNELCEFYHSANDRRRPCLSSDRIQYMNILYIPKLVPECDQGKFALNLAEYNYHILNFKTKPCPYLVINQSCPHSQFCPYIHKGDHLDDLNGYRRKIMPRADPEPEKVGSSPVKKNNYMTALPTGETVYIAGKNINFQEDSEHAFIQLKNSVQIEKKLKSLQDYLCAFANSSGGVLYLGVRPSGHIDGTTCDRATLDRIRLAIDHARMSIRPTLIQCSQVRLETRKVVNSRGELAPDMYVMEVHVRKGVPNETYTLVDDRILVREGKENKELGGAELIQHVVQKAKLARKGINGVLEP